MPILCEKNNDGRTCGAAKEYDGTGRSGAAFYRRGEDIHPRIQVADHQRRLRVVRRQVGSFATAVVSCPG